MLIDAVIDTIDGFHATLVEHYGLKSIFEEIMFAPEFPNSKVQIS